MKWKCTDFKCVWKPTKNRLTAISINISTETLEKRKIYSASMGPFKWIWGRLGWVTKKVKAQWLTAYLFAWCVPAWLTHTQTDSFRSVFSERELKFMFAICHRPSVCRLSVVCLSVTLVHPTQAIEIFGDVSTPFGSLAICWHPGKILRRSSQGNPSVGGVNQKRGSRI